MPDTARPPGTPDGCPKKAFEMLATLGIAAAILIRIRRRLGNA